jgi:heterodisulfide reductase subunit A-like polyferredoxin
MSEFATQKTKDLIRMSVRRAALQEPIISKPVPVTPVGLVVGGGLGGLTAALMLAEQGFETHLVEQADHLGGRHVSSALTLEGFDPAEHVKDLVQRVEDHSRITVHTEAEIEGFSGHVGNFVTKIKSSVGTQISIRHGTGIIATGAQAYRSEEFYYGKHSAVVTQNELSNDIRTDPNSLSALKSVVMIQCVGSRNEQHPYCSRVCCSQAVANALKIKELNPEAEVIVLYRDLRTFGFKELFYKEARKQGVIFIRYDKDHPPEVYEEGSTLRTGFTEPSLKRKVVVSPDRLVLSTALRPHSKAGQVARVFKLPRDDQGFLLEAHIKLRPLDFATEGMFLCGDGHSPKFPEETIAQAWGAAGRALAVLSRDVMYVGPSSEVNPDLCAACMICVRTCPYGVPSINEDGFSEIDPASCRGCGMCAVACPAQAISVHHNLSEQIEAKMYGLFADKVAN